MGDIVPLNPITLRPATVCDIEATADFVARCWRGTYSTLWPAEAAGSQDRPDWRGILTHSVARGWLAMQGERIVGYADRSQNNIDNLWVDAAYRRRGIATRLLRQLGDDMRSHRFVYAQIGVEALNREAQRFLEHCGWACIGEDTLRLASGLVVGVRVYALKLEPGAEQHQPRPDPEPDEPSTPAPLLID